MKLPTIPPLPELQLSIAEKARNARIYAGLTQSELSRCSGVSYATIRKFEMTGEISLKSLLKIADTINESRSFTNLFKKGAFLMHFDSNPLKRPKRCKNGTFHSDRKPTERELLEAMD